MTQKNNKPIKSFKAGSIEASVWSKEAEINGRTVTKYSVHIQKQFYRKDKGYEKTDYYFPDDLPNLRMLSEEVFRFIRLREKESE